MRKIIIFLLLVIGIFSISKLNQAAAAVDLNCGSDSPQTKCTVTGSICGTPCSIGACGTGCTSQTQRKVTIMSATDATSCCQQSASGCYDSSTGPYACVDDGDDGDTGGGACSNNGEWGGCGSNKCPIDNVSQCIGGKWTCVPDPGECNVSSGFDCTTCNYYRSSPASTSTNPNQDGSTNASIVANCYRQDNGGATCCSCLNNGQCEGAWNCVSPGTYAWECTQRGVGQVCGPAEEPTLPPEPTLTPTVTPIISPTPTSVVPSPTINPACTCDTGDVCNTACTFEKFTDVNYISPLKCYLSPSLFPTPPVDKNSWCQRGLRTKGDADGSGVVNNTDYFYYVAAVNGGQIPVNVNPDFNGDGEVGSIDRTIVTKSLNP